MIVGVWNVLLLEHSNVIMVGVIDIVLVGLRNNSVGMRQRFNVRRKLEL